MFAQTLAYGLFASRQRHHGAAPFRRQDAAYDIPKTNPFLRKLFSSIVGPDLDDEPFVGFVDDLAQLLAQTDMDAVLADFGRRTRREDPIVHFYETFLTAYDPKLRELRGVYYTPEPVVSYIVRSVDALLRSRFGCAEGLADTSAVSYRYEDQDGWHDKQAPRVLLLDPACGTGTFLYAVVDHIREQFQRRNAAGLWPAYVSQHLLPRLFGFELLMAPYAMAHLKLGLQLAAADLPAEQRARWAYQFESDERLGVFLTNTLDEAQKRASTLTQDRYISDEAD
jgi:predicted helicase